jgi:hypothetical protein
MQSKRQIEASHWWFGNLRVWQFHATLAFQILVTGQAGAKE